MLVYMYRKNKLISHLLASSQDVLPWVPEGFFFNFFLCANSKRRSRDNEPQRGIALLPFRRSSCEEEKPLAPRVKTYKLQGEIFKINYHHDLFSMLIKSFILIYLPTLKVHLNLGIKVSAS